MTAEISRTDLWLDPPGKLMRNTSGGILEAVFVLYPYEETLIGTHRDYCYGPRTLMDLSSLTSSCSWKWVH